MWFKKPKTFARFKTEKWCIQLAYVDEKAEDVNDVKYLLVGQDLFDRSVNAKAKKRKDFKQTVRSILSVITKKNRP